MQPKKSSTPTVGVAELMTAANIKNRRTLNRWLRKGVLPAPEIVQHPSGRGRRAVWPAWVLDHCRIVSGLTDQGQTLDMIAGLFGTDWAAVAARYPQSSAAPPLRRKLPLSFVPVDSQKIDGALNLSEAERVRVAVEQKLAKRTLADINLKLSAALGTARKQLQGATLPAVEAELRDRAIELYQCGCRPVLVVAPPRPYVVADFQVSTLISEASVDTAYLIVPLAETLDEQVAQGNQVVRPAKKVLVTENGTEREVPFIPLLNLSFEFGTE